MGNNRMTTPGKGEHITEQLSAYIDNALDANERESVRLHLEGCALCTVEHDEMLATRNLLRSVPMVAPPRAFTLTREMAGVAEKKAGFWDRLLTRSNSDRLATGSVLAVGLVLLLLVGNLALFRQVTNTFSRIGSAVNVGGGYSESSAQPPDALRQLESPGGPVAEKAPDPATAGASAGDTSITMAAIPTTTTAAGVARIETAGTPAMVPALAPTLQADTGGEQSQPTSTSVGGARIAIATMTALTEAQALVTSEREASGAPGVTLAEPAPRPVASDGSDTPGSTLDGFTITLITLLVLGTALGVGAFLAGRRRA
jgi:hypothetical protein